MWALDPRLLVLVSASQLNFRCHTQKEGSVEKFLSTLRDIPEDISEVGNEEILDIESDNQWHKNFKRTSFALHGGRTWHAFHEEFYYVNQKGVMLVQIETSNNLHVLQHETDKSKTTVQNEPLCWHTQ